MDEIKKNEVLAPTKEELEQEQNALKEAKEEEIRQSIISEFGFDEVEDVERIDKLVAREVENHKKLSGAINQKINWRNKANEKKEVPSISQPHKETNVSEEEIGKKVNEKVSEVFEQRDLDEMSYPDEIKNEIKRVAKIQEVSVKKASQDPYVVSRIEAYKKEQEAVEAGISRTHKTGGKKVEFTDEPPVVDIKTPEGQKTWDEWKGWKSKKDGKMSL